MKSYFAKLAARATVTNAPAHPVNARMAPDPFEPPVTTSEANPRTVSPPIRSSDELPLKRGDVSKSPSRTIQLQPVTEPTVIQAQKPTTVSAPVTDAEQSVSEASSISELRPSRQDSETRSTARVEAQDLNVTSTTNPNRLSPETPRSGDQASRPTSTTRERSQSTDDDAVNERLSNVENEQAILLRKADTFMAGLFERRQRSNQETEREERADDSQARPAISESLIQAPARLKPPSAPARVSEPADEGPALVIEKLSVEVVPTPSPAISPQRQIVVIGGSRRTSAGIPSAHRFGFSRY
ncbi:MAG TPA: hypothetical protein VLA93_22180 [Pyrinomonadaceae bacterium]|nr:hypothetical protein [Pyrinomonadaceae bacterium]